MSQRGHRARRPSATRQGPEHAHRTLRIIAGHWRGTRLTVADVDGLRPTGDRIRETLFNWLSPQLSGARCLDAFAGSGALGLEALSRGAKAVDAFEISPIATGQIKGVVERLNADAYSLFEVSFVVSAPELDQPYDVIFLDPPFSSDLLTQSIQLILEHKLLAPSGLVYLECDRECGPPELPASWQLFKEKRAGDVWFGLARCGGDTDKT